MDFHNDKQLVDQKSMRNRHLNLDLLVNLQKRSSFDIEFPAPDSNGSIIDPPEKIEKQERPEKNDFRIQ